MAEPVIVPVTAKFIDVDTSELDFKNVEKEISKSMSGIKKAINDAFSGIDASAINKPIEKSMTAIESSLRAVEKAHHRVTEAMIKAGKGTDAYKNIASELDEAKKRLDGLNAIRLSWEDSEGDYIGTTQMWETYLDVCEKYEAQLYKVRDLQKQVDNPSQFVKDADPLSQSKVESSIQEYVSTVVKLNKKTEDFNQTAHDNRWSDEYTELVKQAESYKKKLDDLNEKSKRMKDLGATDKQWDTLSYDLKQTSWAMDDVLKKMRKAKKTGSAFRFGSGDESEIKNQINSFARSNRNARKDVGGRIVDNRSPFTEDFQKSLDELDRLEKKMQSLKAKSDKMIELGASKKQFESLAYEAETLKSKIEEVKNRIMTTPALEIRTDKTEAMLQNTLNNVRDKADGLQSSLTGVANNAKKAQGGLTKLAVTHPKLAKLLGTVGKIANGFVAVAKASGKVASSIGRVTSNIFKSIKGMLSFGKSGRSTSNDLNSRFKKLGRNILMFGLGFRTAYYAVKRLRNIFIEGFKVMGDSFDEVGAPMKTMIESFNRLKGSLATAFQPIVSVVMPILTRLMNYLSGMLEKIGEFTAVLTGQGHIYKAVAKNVNSVAGAAKNANNALGSYDKLEVIQDNNTGYDYEKQTVGEAESAASNFANMVKEAWEKADFTGVGAYVTEQLWNVLDKIETNLIPKTTGFVNKVLKSVNTFLQGFDSTKIGAKVGSIINTLVSGLDWKQLGAVFANLQNTVWGFLDGLVNAIDWLGLGNSLADGIISMFDTLNIDRWVSMVSGLVIGLTTALVTVIDRVDWKHILNTLWTAIENLLTSVGEAMSNSNNPLVSGFGNVILALKDTLNELKPAIDVVLAAISPLIQSILPIISELLPPIAKIVSDIVVTVLPPLVELIQVLLPPIIRLVQVILPILNDVLNIISIGLRNLMNFISVVVVPLFDVFVGVIELAFSTIGVLFRALRGDFSSVEDLFGALLSAWKKPINSILGAVESLVNGVIRGLNSMIKAMNKLSFDVPDWVPGIGGKKFGFNIKEISTVKIPRLAQGAVIPPNKEFLAMLGDQKHGTNIEAPLDTIKQALAEVLAEVGGGTREPIVLQVSGRTLAKVVWDEQEKRYKQTGRA